MKALGISVYQEGCTNFVSTSNSVPYNFRYIESITGHNFCANFWFPLIKDGNEPHHVPGEWVGGKVPPPWSFQRPRGRQTQKMTTLVVVATSHEISVRLRQSIITILLVFAYCRSWNGCKKISLSGLQKDWKDYMSVYLSDREHCTVNTGVKTKNSVGGTFLMFSTAIPLGLLSSVRLPDVYLENKCNI